MVYFYIGIVVGAVIALAMSYVRRKHSYWADRDVLCYAPTFPYGNLKGLGRLRNLHEIHQDFYGRAKRTGVKFMGLYFFTKPVVLAIDLDFVKTIMVKDFQYFHDRGVYHNERDDPLSAHLFAIDGQRWRTLRTKLSPTFTSGKMKLMFPTIIKISVEFAATVEASLKSGPDVEMREILARFTTDVIGTCAFGLDCNSLKDPEAEFRINGRKLFEKVNMAKQIFTSLFAGLSKRLRVTTVPKDVSDFFMKAVRDTIAYRELNNVKRNDFMDLLIEIKNSPEEADRLTVEEIAAQAFIFFLAGFETSSTAMSFALYELALNQEVQNRARECVQQTLRKSNGELTYETMMEMTYITQCINESLRKYPPVADLIRIVTEDYPVPESKVVFPKGQTVFIPVYAIHHDPEIYENPSHYDPERFTPENEAMRNPYAFLPFGEGPRNCIGLRFGMMQARIGLAVLLSHYRFDLSSKTRQPLKMSKSSPILSPVGGIWLKVEKI